MEKKTPFWKKALSVISLWVMTWVGGPLVVGFLNLLAPLLFWRDTQQPGSFSYAFLVAISGAVGVAIGAYIMNALTKEEDSLFRIVNYIVLGTTIAVVYICMMVFLKYSDVVYIIQAALAVIACIVYTVSERKQMQK